MSEIAGQTGLSGTGTATVHESYAFACMRCGHGWEQSYAIEHHTDTEGRQCIRYVADGRVVPSPLSRPACQNCDGHVVRIMRAGQVSSVHGAAVRPRHTASPTPPAEVTTAPADVSTAHEDHHWHLSDLLHPFQRRAS
ncbi:hypothetical protein [Streptomyces sp. NPDC005573]|uniref:hypothetical protein n=1 Tax=unclassified Streptomyces TaxID=2593676 RepID=UPI0033A0C21B